MNKYYKVIKDHPLWEVGAILKQQDNDSESYKAISDIWTKELKNDRDISDWTEGKNLVEGQPEWFQRVYSVKVLGQAKYLSREAAKKFHHESYKEK